MYHTIWLLVPSKNELIGSNSGKIRETIGRIVGIFGKESGASWGYLGKIGGIVGIFRKESGVF